MRQDFNPRYIVSIEQQRFDECHELERGRYRVGSVSGEMYADSSYGQDLIWVGGRFENAPIVADRCMDQAGENREP